MKLSVFIVVAVLGLATSWAAPQDSSAAPAAEATSEEGPIVADELQGHGHHGKRPKEFLIKYKDERYPDRYSYEYKTNLGTHVFQKGIAVPNRYYHDGHDWCSCHGHKPGCHNHHGKPCRPQHDDDDECHPGSSISRHGKPCPGASQFLQEDVTEEEPVDVKRDDDIIDDTETADETLLDVEEDEETTPATDTETESSTESDLESDVETEDPSVEDLLQGGKKCKHCPQQNCKLCPKTTTRPPKTTTRPKTTTTKRPTKPTHHPTKPTHHPTKPTHHPTKGKVFIVPQGGFEYTSPDCYRVKVRYSADFDGFKPIVHIEKIKHCKPHYPPGCHPGASIGRDGKPCPGAEQP